MLISGMAVLMRDIHLRGIPWSAAEEAEEGSTLVPAGSALSPTSQAGTVHGRQAASGVSVIDGGGWWIDGCTRSACLDALNLRICRAAHFPMSAAYLREALNELPSMDRKRCVVLAIELARSAGPHELVVFVPSCSVPVPWKFGARTHVVSECGTVFTCSVQTLADGLRALLRIISLP